MASNQAVRFVQHLRTLSDTVIGGVSSYDLFNAWITSTQTQDLYARVMVFKSLVLWANENCYTFPLWCGEILTRWEEHLKSIGNKPSTIAVKLSNVRQVLLVAQSEGIIPTCVYYQRRGRKPKNPETRLAVIPEQPKKKAQSEKPKRTFVSSPGKIDRTFLYSFFDLDEDFTSEDLKQAFKRVATQYHPDHNSSGNATEQFLACREMYNFLADEESRSLYEDFTHQKRGRPNTIVMSFITNMHTVFSAQASI